MALQGAHERAHPPEHHLRSSHIASIYMHLVRYIEYCIALGGHGRHTQIEKLHGPWRERMARTNREVAWPLARKDDTHKSRSCMAPGENGWHAQIVKWHGPRCERMTRTAGNDTEKISMAPLCTRMDAQIEKWPGPRRERMTACQHRMRYIPGACAFASNKCGNMPPMATR